MYVYKPHLMAMYLNTVIIGIHSFFFIRTSIFLAEAEPKLNVLIFLAI